SICYYSLRSAAHRDLPSFPTRRSSDLHDALDLLRLLDQPAGELGKGLLASVERGGEARLCLLQKFGGFFEQPAVILEAAGDGRRSEEHTSELQSRENLVCRLLLEKKNE